MTVWISGGARHGTAAARPVRLDEPGTGIGIGIDDADPR